MMAGSEFQCEYCETQLVGAVAAEYLYYHEDGTPTDEMNTPLGVAIKTRLKHPWRKRYTIHDHVVLSPGEARRLAAMLTAMADQIETGVVRTETADEWLSRVMSA